MVIAFMSQKAQPSLNDHSHVGYVLFYKCTLFDRLVTLKIKKKYIYKVVSAVNGHWTWEQSAFSDHLSYALAFNIFCKFTSYVVTERDSLIEQDLIKK